MVDSFPGSNAKADVMQRKSIIHRLAAFVILISFGITDAAVVFVSIWYNHTTNEKALWLEFDTSLSNSPKCLSLSSMIVKGERFLRRDSYA